MDTITGKDLFTTRGERVGEIVDVLGLYGTVHDVGWLTVKINWRLTRLVPHKGIEPRGDAFTTPFTLEEIRSAPKVPVHFEPAGEERDALSSHYGARLAGL